MRKNLNQKDYKKNIKRAWILLLLLIMCSTNVSATSSLLDSIPFNTLNDKKLADESDKVIPDAPVPLATVDLLGFPDPLVLNPKEPEPLRSQRRKKGTVKKQTATVTPAETKPEIVAAPAPEPVSTPTPAPVQIIDDADVPLAQPVIHNTTENNTVINYVESSDDNSNSITSSTNTGGNVSSNTNNNSNSDTTNNGSNNSGTDDNNSPDTDDNNGSGTDDNNSPDIDNNDGPGTDDNNNPDTGNNNDSDDKENSDIDDNDDVDSMGYDKSAGAYNNLYERACALAEAFDSCAGEPESEAKQNALLETGKDKGWVGSNDQFRSKLLKDIGEWPCVTEDSDAVEAVKESHLFADINKRLETLENNENIDDLAREKEEKAILKEAEKILNDLRLNIYVIPPRNGAERQVVLYINHTGKGWNSDLIYDGDTWYETKETSFTLASPLNTYNWEEFKTLYMDGEDLTTVKGETITGQVKFYELGSINYLEEKQIAPLTLAAPALPLVNEIAPEIINPDEKIVEEIIEDEVVEDGTIIDGDMINENVNTSESNQPNQNVDDNISDTVTDTNDPADNTTESPDNAADSSDNSAADSNPTDNSSSDSSSSDSSSSDSGSSDSSSSDSSSSDSSSSDSSSSDSSSSDSSSSDSSSSDSSSSDSSSSDSSSLNNETN